MSYIAQFANALTPPAEQMKHIGQPGVTFTAYQKDLVREVVLCGIREAFKARSKRLKIRRRARLI